jgi:hypothetical protein
MELTEVTKFRRAVLTGLARFTWQGTLPEHIYDILYSVFVAVCIRNGLY